jgi:tripartite-type tricarboxylate transporter receptor subunit TctC
MKPQNASPLHCFTGLRRSVALATLLLLPAAAQAQGFPEKPVQFIVPFPAGATLDAVVRQLGERMAEGLRQPVVVENKTGASGIIGLTAAAKSAPDGYTLVSVSNSFAANPILRKDLPFDAARDFAPVALIGSTPHVLAVHPGISAGTVKELVEQARQKPGSLSYGSGGAGTISHFAGELLKSAAGIDLVHVPFRGQGPALTATLSSSVSMTFGNMPEVMPHVRGGKLKALAIATAQRSSLAPQLPTIAESGYPSVTSESWYGFMVPARTPPEVIRRLNTEVNRALAHPELRARLIAQGVEPGGGSVDEFSAFLRQKSSDYARIIKEANIRAE